MKMFQDACSSIIQFKLVNNWLENAEVLMCTNNVS